jgi:hypothetical protein
MTHAYACRRAGELVLRELGWENARAKRAALWARQRLAVDDYELWRRRLIRLLLVAAGVLVAYWVAWYADRGLIASDHTATYISFEQAFPLADGWLALACVMSGLSLARRQARALPWLAVTGGAGVYLFALDVLYDLEHGIYGRASGGLTEAAINLLTLALGVGLLRFAWRFQRELLGEARAVSPHRTEEP